MKRLFCWFFLALFFVTPVMATFGDVVTNYHHRWEGEGDATDTNGTVPLSMTGTYNCTDAVQGQCSFYFDDNAEHAVNDSTSLGIAGGNGALSMVYWMKLTDNTEVYPGGVGSYSTAGTMFFSYIQSATVMQMLGLANDLSFTVPTLNTGQWYHVAYVYYGNKTVSLYINGTKVDEKTLGSNQNLDTSLIRIAKSHATAEEFLGQIDDYRLYDFALSGAEVSTIYNNPNSTSEPKASEKRENVSFFDQTTSTSINSNVYTTIYSTEVEISQNVPIYVTANLQTNSTASNELECQILIEGNPYDSLLTRTNTAGSIGNIYLMTNRTNVSTNTTVSMECRRASGSGTITLSNSTMITHILSDGGGEINNSFESLSGAVGATAAEVDSYSFTTSENEPTAGLTRSIIIDYSGNYTYSATGNITTTFSIGGTNCTPATRYGTSGSTAVIGGSCTFLGATNSTAYNVTLYTQGATGTANYRILTKELIVHNNELNTTSLSGLQVNNNTWVNVTSLQLDNQHANASMVLKAGISTYANYTNQTCSFRFNHDGNEAHLGLSRNAVVNQPGVVQLQHVFEDEVTGVHDLYLQAYCPSSNVTFSGIDFVAYIAEGAASVPNSFTITAYNNYTNASIQNFDVDINGSIFTTDNGSLDIFTQQDELNLTFPGTNTTTIKFFTVNVNNHPTNTTLNQSLIPWTEITAYTPALLQVNNFSINYSQGNTTLGTFSTTTGIIYVPLFNDSFNVTIYDAIDVNEVQYAIQTQEKNASDYIERFNFSLQLTNSINIQFFDEETGQPVNNVTLSYYSLSGDSGNTSTNNSYILLALLTPATYTLIYDADGYLERFYEFTLVDDTFNNLNLTLLNSTTGTTVTITVKDTLDSPVEGLTIKIRKFDPADNEEDLIEVRETNFEGQTIASMVLNGPLYSFVIEESDGTVLLSTGRTQIYGTSLNFIVDLAKTEGFEEVFAAYRLSGDVTWNNATNTFTFEYNDESNTLTQSCLTIYRIEEAKTQYNETCSSSPSGTLSSPVVNASGRAYEAVGWVTLSNSTTYNLDSEIATFGDPIPENGSGLLMMFIMVVAFLSVLSINMEIAIITASAVPLIFTATQLTRLEYSITVPILIGGLIVSFIIGMVRR